MQNKHIVKQGEIPSAVVAIKVWADNKDITSLDLREATISMETLSTTATSRRLRLLAFEKISTEPNEPKFKHECESISKDVLTLIVTQKQKHAYNCEQLAARKIAAFAFSLGGVFLSITPFNNDKPYLSQAVLGLVIGPFYLCQIPLKSMELSSNYKKALAGIVSMEAACAGTYLASMLPIEDTRVKIGAYGLLACAYLFASTKALSHECLELTDNPSRSAL